ncbi:RHS repeat-associated core domain-containing protein [Paracoccus aminophilus]|uniref:Uncharacterized protein n=1 Tax=Paracoccus aminophilus JCM 7686 TaxID=1367847 RepID=S5YEV2_PARAH|nr:RHS repeat-associated core domain-containing protein [Paracoccus aminophilus]AGT10003.1 hypothetical protein JCM7686_2967 [Paracoccus aminophilus JCM 7686]
MSGMIIGATAGAGFSHRGAGNSDGRVFPDQTGRSEFEAGWDDALDVVESQGVQNTVMVGSVVLPGLVAGVGAAAGGATLGATGAAAAAAALPAAVGLGAGIVGGAVGSFLGEGLGHLAMSTIGSAFGYQRMVDKGEMPATVGHPIAHVNKWAVLGAMVLGAVAAVAVAAIIIASAGTATLLVVAAAGLAAGFVGGLGMGFASAAGQYGKNKGLIMKGSPNVYFQNKPVARVTDLVACTEHGGPQFVAEGAKTVFANNWPIARIGHMTTCSGKINDGCKTIAIDLDTSAIRMDIDGGWAERGVRTGLALLDLLPIPKGGKGDHPNGPHPKPKPDVNGPPKPKPHPHDEAPRPKPGEDGTPPKPKPGGDPDKGPNPKRTEAEGNQGKPNENCTTGGDPVDVATGQVFETRTDIAIPGTIPLVLKRSYRPGAEGVQGRHWAGTWAQHLRLNGEEIAYQDEDGVLISFHAPEDGVDAGNIRFPHLTLAGERSGSLYVYDRHRQIFWIFDHSRKARRLLSRIEDRNGNRIDLIYNESGLHELRHSDGFSLSVESRDMVIRRAVLNAPDSADCGFVWSYTDRNVLTEAISAQTGTLRYSYDAQERLTGWADTGRTEAHYEYGPDGRVARNWTASGHLNTEFAYDLAAKRTVMTDASGAVTCYDWNDQGLVWRSIDPLGGEWLTEWGRHLNVVSNTDPLGNVTRFDYDRWGDLIRITDPEGASESWSYTLSGRIQSHTDKAGHSHVFRYDTSGNLGSVEQPDGSFIRFRRLETGQVLRIDYPGGRQERFAYDMLQRPRMLRTAAGFEQHMRFDGEGRLVRFSDEIGGETRWDHQRGPDNPRGNIRSVTLANGITAEASYDSEGMLAEAVNGEGARRRYRFGAFDLCEEIIDENGHSVKTEHDALLRLTALVNQKGERYEIGYDACSRITAERDYAGLVTRYHYDAAGRLAQSVLPDGAIRRYTRSASGRMIEMVVQRGAELSKTTFAYDALGRLIRAVSAEGAIEYSYDAMGRIIRESQNGREILSDYAGEEPGRTARRGDALPFAAQYNLAGQLSELQLGQHEALSFAYDPRGLEIMRSTQAGFALAQGYDAVGLMVEQIAGPLSALPDEVRFGVLTGGRQNEHITRAGALAHRTYLWDRAQRAISVNDRITGEKRFEHDPRGQVVSVSRQTARGEGASLSRFGYDPNQNLTEIATAMGQEKLVQDAGRVRQRGKISYRHDAAGRVVEKRLDEPGFRPKIWRMGWNGQGQLVRLETPEGAVWRYIYDAVGRRVQRLKLMAGGREDKAAPGYIPEGGGRAYHWEGTQIIAEAPLGPEGADWEHAAHWLYEPGSHRPMARAVGDDLHYVVTDHIGTPRELFAEDGAAVLWRQELSLWGEVEPLAPRPTAANDDHAPDPLPIRFQGQWADEESGLYYNNQRYYDPDATQYLSPDPIGLLGGIRPQGYVADPNGWVDPLGLKGCSDKLRANLMDDMGMPRGTRAPGYQAQHVIPGALDNHPAWRMGGQDIDGAGNGMFLPDRGANSASNADRVSPLTRHQGSHKGYNDAVEAAMNRIDLSLGPQHVASEIQRLQNVLRQNQMNGVPIRSSDWIGSVTPGGTKTGTARANAYWSDILTKAGF